MKKITIIASLLVLFAACQKADIRPRTGSTESIPEMRGLSTEKSSTDRNKNSLNGSTTNSTVDSSNPTGEPSGGDITDPLRKKDQKDNR